MEMRALTDRLLGASERIVALVEGRELAALDDGQVMRVMGEITSARNALDVLAACAARVIDARSARELGVAGLAQRQGHRTATELLQSLTGRSRSEVSRSVKTGGDLLDATTVLPGEREGGARGAASSGVPENVGGCAEWLELLSDALRDGAVSQAQFQAIRVGLGEPPVERYPDLDAGFLPRAWVTAVERLIDEAPHLPVEELRASARIARDRLDPVGVTLRFEERFAARSYRSWVDEHGQRHGRFVFDDDAAAWVDAILQAALRPRRGPRFVEADAGNDLGVRGAEGVRDAEGLRDAEGVRGARDVAGLRHARDAAGLRHARDAAGLRHARDAADERSGEQIAYDTLIAVMRTGAAADPAQAFGDRQPGVRIVVEGAAFTGPGAAGKERARTEVAIRAVGHLEDGGEALPAGVVESYLCDAGAVPVSLDDAGRPLDVGRHQRLFTRAQRVAIAVRDGGCVGIGCRAPISQCEMHHIDHWAHDRGRTDVDDGVPLCRNHHLGLHNRGEKIVRERDPVTGQDTYWLHAPPDPRTGEVRLPYRLRSRSPRRFDAA
ncbi:HNH endonuclease signature motif containing protein [Microbacterium sp.]|uniref:HNH endonuclease signature motif containing protein n=1 Tax=Microbacterium sp. TaxID=51671 RepID=UPI0025E66960|nr:HNH endonuclease signature motif containing protein [Microbacterium sp.]MBT9607097.1 HNH endonuclease [Microbacterium sp.]